MDANPVTAEQGWELVKSFAGLLFTIIGGGAFIVWIGKKIINRRFAQSDTTKELRDANQGKAIDADKDAFVIVARRLEVIEARCDKIQDDLTKQMETNATLTAENRHLQKENDAQTVEIKDLRDRLRSANDTIGELRRELDALKLRFDGVDPLNVRLVDGEK